MNALLFAESEAKVERTESQIADLDSNISEFLDSCEPTRSSSLSRGLEIWRFGLNKPVPLNIPVMVGEILFNLRSSLDVMMCNIAILNGQSTKDVYFPFGKSSPIFETELNKKANKLPADVHGLLRSLQPYKGGNNLLWALHDLNRRDKHVSLVPVVETCRVYMQSLVVHEGQVLTIGPRCGRHLYFDGKNLVQPEHSRQPRIVSQGQVVRYAGEQAIDFGYIPDSNMSPNDGFVSVIYNQIGSVRSSQTRISTYSDIPGCELTAENCLEFMTSSPNSRIEGNIQPVINMGINETDLIPLLPVTSILKEMRLQCRSIINIFRSHLRM